VSALDEVIALREEIARRDLPSQPIGDVALVLVIGRLDASIEKLEDVRRMLDLIDDRLASINTTIGNHK
jgi:hypothetical protein